MEAIQVEKRKRAKAIKPKTPGYLVFEVKDGKPKFFRSYQEIDIKDKLADLTEIGFIHQESQQLFSFGADKAIWILTKARLFVLASKDGKWEMKDWNKNVELLENQFFNIGKYIEEEGIHLEN